MLATLQCFVKKDGNFLMLHRNPHKKIMPNVWMAPGGKREFNEGLFACTRREIREETGLEIKNIRIRATGCVYLKDLDQELCVHFLEAEYAGGKLHEHPEDGELRWVTPAQIAKLNNLLAEMKELLPHLFGNKRQEVVSFTAVYERGNDMAKFTLEDSA